jgi:glycopeptide antibiotics resistance protein
LLWSYKEALSVHNGGDSGLRILITDSGLLKEIILNILLYVPFGYLLPFTWPKLAQKKQEASGNRLTHCFWSIPWKVVLIGILCSTVTEVTQLVFHLGLFEYDDIFNNALGCLIGALIYNGFLRKHKERSAK